MRRLGALQLAWLAYQFRAAVRFERAVRQPERTLAKTWARLQPVLADSVRGRQLALSRVTDVADLQRLPVMDGEDLAPWTDRIAAGEARVLTAEPVEMMEPTSGGRGPRKLIPYTARLRAEFAEAIAVWMVDLHRARPGLLGTRSYWSVSRAVRRDEHTAGGLPIGFQSDAAYFDPISQWAIGKMMAVDGQVATAPTLEDWRHQTLRQLISCADLGLISVWSPSFLTQLLTALDQSVPQLLPELAPSARRRLQRSWNGKSVHIERLWPRLQLVSAWGDGFAKRLLPDLQLRLGAVPIQAKGVLATEGVVSIPLGGGPGHVLAVTSHLIELRDVRSGEVIWPHQARLGGAYQVLLSTGGGLLRYAMPDKLQVVGWYGRIPRVKLVGRLDRGSDMVGEKLTPGFVQQALATLWPTPPSFAMLVPRPDAQGYALVTSKSVESQALEAKLRKSYHYNYARDLGQLRPAIVVHRVDGWRRYERGVEAVGGLLGDQKPEALEVRPALVAALLTD